MYTISIIFFNLIHLILNFNILYPYLVKFDYSMDNNVKKLKEGSNNGHFMNISISNGIQNNYDINN
jgi:hypothetical protein